jgi:hypothetical protein
MALPAIGLTFAAILPWITRLIMAKGVLLFAGFLGRLGFVFIMNEFFIQFIIEYAINMWNAIPSEWQCWFALLGVTKAAGIYVSGMTLIGAKRVFFAKS